MWIVTKLNVSTQEVGITYADCKNEDRDAKLNCMQAVFNELAELKKNEEGVQMNIQDDQTINIYKKGYLYGKEQLFKYQIINCRASHMDDDEDN